MTSAIPKVTVLLSTHNGEKYLRQSLDSMAAQTRTDWEWVLVDNASTDATPDILASYGSQFPDRIRIVRNDSKLDLADSLNRGLSIARGVLIARMDDDDVAHPDRLYWQVRAMEEDPELAVVGTAVHRLDEASSRVDELISQLDPVQLRISLCWHNPFMHASVMFRRMIKPDRAAFYPTEYSFAEDYGMWAQLARTGRVRVLERKLLTYRKRSGGMTGTGRDRQLESTLRVSDWYTREFTVGTPLEGIPPDELRRWYEETAHPDARRLARVRQMFDAAARSPFVTGKENRRAFMGWAAPFLDRQEQREFTGWNSGQLFRACGRDAAGYLVRRFIKKKTE